MSEKIEPAPPAPPDWWRMGGPAEHARAFREAVRRLREAALEALSRPPHCVEIREGRP